MRAILVLVRWIILGICMLNAVHGWSLDKTPLEIFWEEGFSLMVIITVACVFILIRIVQASLLVLLNMPVNPLFGLINFIVLIGALYLAIMFLPFRVFALNGVLGVIIWFGSRQAYEQAMLDAGVPGRPGNVYLRSLFDHTHPFFDQAGRSLAWAMSDWTFFIAPFLP